MGIQGKRIAVEPADLRPWLKAAVLAGGGEIVPLSEAEALVWTDGFDVPSLRRCLAEGQGIRWVQLPWAGVEPFAQAGILDPAYVWTCGKGVYAQAVAEHALALTLAGLRDLKQRALAQTWQPGSGTSLRGSRVVIFGAGGIAQALIQLLQPFRCSIDVVRRRADPLPGASRVVTLAERQAVLAGADVVILALALTPETEGIIARPELEQMGAGCWLVNVARGKHIVTADLVSALQEGIIRGAALDVTDPEPLPEGHPLWRLPNCLITPHTAITDAMIVPALSERVRENVRRFRLGEPLLGVVDPVLGY
ncbi:D-isomer specific 2-hydroxyacid dehydrogenase family protein [Synechococcus sp. H65.1]|uniref:D-isomer specific 2-hydroxyacid dehydrogenase family protein n=1 Tax=unclassified Synechococcus TaxID=2626047 RepID=UPI0039C4DAA4